MFAVKIKEAVIFVPLKFKQKPADKHYLSPSTRAFMKNGR
jgi:hypothetical protein